MKVVVTGTRGIPDVQGGVETHCQNLYPLLARDGFDVTVIRRKPYVENDPRTDYEGVKIVDLFTPRKKSFEAIIHTFLAVIRAKRMKADVLHIHAIGPAIMAPFARLLGLKVVMTNHGPDYDRQKWGRAAKVVLKMGERLGSKWANKVIVISPTIRDIVARKYGRTDTELIFNGVNTPVKSANTDYVESLGLTPDKYILAVGRFVEEKGFHDLIHAFKKISTPGYKLVIAGDADHPDKYSEELKRLAAETPGVVLTGFIHGEQLNQVETNAALFVIPSYHEGLPFSLLEAMSYGIDALASDIPANRINELNDADFFPVGSVDELAKGIERKLSENRINRAYNLSAYDWEAIARQTAQVYKNL